ncbi:MAG: hypothetical protein DRQ43_05205 [Gammaproteobacteria bacterium]|nr:MAG: hypothetical protein DRQ43_05205 [Gammaproteobacteria bacterium]
MAIKATIYKVKLDISDCDRNYFQSHDLIISCHPSETEQRMMVRLLAFSLFACAIALSKIPLPMLR